MNEENKELSPLNDEEVLKDSEEAVEETETENFDEGIESDSTNDTEDDYENLIEKAAAKREERKRKKKKKIIKRIIISVICLILAAIIAVGSLAFLEIRGEFSASATVSIERGSSTFDIAEELEKSGAINSAFLFRLYCKVKGYGSDFQFGTYKIKEDSSYREIADILSKQGNSVIVKVTIPEGTGIYDYVKKVNGNYVTIPGIGTLLEESGVCKKEDFYDALKKTELKGLAANADTEKAYVPLEGYLFPDTYEFYAYESKECAALAVEKMLGNMNNKFTDEMKKRAEEINMSVNEVLALASIIQMEAGNAGDDMPKVAAVFYNRLNRGEKLGSSPTGFYGKAFEQDDGRYNTNEVSGFPPGPICTVSLKTINAALYPEKDFSDYYYFVTDSSGKFYYHKTYNEQINTINRLKRENKWIYESFD